MRLRLNGKIIKNFWIAFIALFACMENAYAQEITAIDFNGDLIGKVIPDGKVVSFDNRLIGNITADSLILDSAGKLIGGVVPQGVAIGNDNRLLGKVSNDGTVRLSTGKIIGKALPNGLVVDDKFDVLGAVLFPGLIYSDEGQTVGRLTGDGVYANLQGQTIGFVSPDGYAYRRSGNDYIIDGRLISSKMVIDSVGHFVGSISPGGKITNFDGKQIGHIKANGFAYNSDNKVIGSVVRSGYAFDITGKYIGIVTFNGEVVDGEKLIGYLQVDGSIADSKGAIIGYMVDIAATASDSFGKYLGRIMPEGKIAKGRNIVGQIGPWNTVYDSDGKQLGKIISSGPVFDYKGTLKGHALKNGQVIMPSGAPLGTIRNDLAFNTLGKIVGAVLPHKVVIGENNQIVGVSGISSSLSVSDDHRIISPFGYVYNSEGGIAGNAISLGGVYSLGGVSIGAVSPNGELINNGTVQGGIITQYGYSIAENNAISGGKISNIYAVSSNGESLGILADGNQVLNKNFKPTGKILPDGSVTAWSDKNSYMPFNGRGSSARMAISYDGSILGTIDNQGLVRDSGATTIGKVSSSDIILDNSGLSIGEPVNFMSIINDKCEFTGVVTPDGEVKNYREVNMGKILPNRQVVSDNGNIIGYGVSGGSVVDFGGKSIGMVTSEGKVLNYAGENMGCVDSQNRVYNAQRALVGKVVPITTVIDFDGKIVGRSLLDGSIIDSSNKNIGFVSPDDSANSKTSSPFGMLFMYRYAFNNSNRQIGMVALSGEVFDFQGKKIGTVDFDGNVIISGQKSGYALYDLYIYDNDHQAIGRITSDGTVVSLSNQKIGRSVHGFAIDNKGKVLGRGNRDFHIRAKGREIIGELQLNGAVVSRNGEQIGTLGEEGKIVATDGEEVIAVATPLQYYEPEKRKPVFDAAGNTIGYVDENNQVVDEKGNIVGQITKDGSVVNPEGEVIGSTKLDWYRNPEKQQPSGKLPEVGSRKLEQGEYKRSINIALTPDGEYLGEITEDGSVIDKDGKEIGKVQGGLVYDKEGNLVGVEETAKGSTKDNIVTPPGGSESYIPETETQVDPQVKEWQDNAQYYRRKGIAVGHISGSFSKEDFEQKQDDWGLPKVISTYPVDMSMMILSDKPIPAVIARPIYTESGDQPPITAYVERNVYTEDGRNIIIPAGSHVIGEMGSASGDSTGRNKGGTNSARLTIHWKRIIWPNGAMFQLSNAASGDAQGRGGVLGYLDRRIIQTYSMPLASSLITNGLAVLFATSDSSEGGENSAETSKQQAMNDAREGFLSDTQQMFQRLVSDYMQTQPVIFVPAGTRVTIYPNVDLWLRTADNSQEAGVSGSGNLKDNEDILVNDKEVSDYTASLKNSRSNPQTTVTYTPQDSGVQQTTPLIDDAATIQRNRVGTPPPPPPPSSGVVNTTRQPSGNNSSSNNNDNDVPQLF